MGEIGDPDQLNPTGPDANGNEFVGGYGTDCGVPDSDCDGLSDGSEVNYWVTIHSTAWPSNPMYWYSDPDADGSINLLDQDSEDDGLFDGEEVGIYTTDPANADTDSDGIDDGPEKTCWDDHPTSSWDSDVDNDQIINIRDPDSDGDTILDGEEIVEGTDGYVTDPALADTDGDGENDNVEISGGTDPTNANPVAQISAPSGKYESESVTFDVSGSYDIDGTIVTYRFDWGDGSPIQDISPAAPKVHTYESEGIYTVSLTVIDDKDEPSFNPAMVAVTIIDLAPTALFVIDTVTLDREEGIWIEFDASSSYCLTDDLLPAGGQDVVDAYLWCWGDEGDVWHEISSSEYDHKYVEAYIPHPILKKILIFKNV